MVQVDGGIGEVHTVNSTATAGARGETRALAADINTDWHMFRAGYVFETEFNFWPTFLVWNLSHHKVTDFVAQNYYPHPGQSNDVELRIWGW